jgi:hypothetical protein
MTDEDAPQVSQKDLNKGRSVDWAVGIKVATRNSDGAVPMR